MKVFHGYSEAQMQVPPLVYAIGNFDGVHLGHEGLIARAREFAEALNVEFGVYTFWPHPRAVLRPNERLHLITTRAQKLRRFEQLGAKYVVEEPFTLEFSAMPAQLFCTDVIAKGLKAAGVVTGANFRFGHRASGTPERMAEWLMPLHVEHVLAPSVYVGNELCSSGRIRELVSKGDVEQAAQLLGRRFSIIGEVVKGAGRGKSIGVPTANLNVKSSLVPAPGVYATTVRVGDRDFEAATNIGTRPTFSNEEALHVETHLLDFTGDLYGREIEIAFTKRIRDEKKFGSPDALVKQIRADIEVVRKA